MRLCIKALGLLSVWALASGAWAQSTAGFDGGKAVTREAVGSVLLGNRAIEARCTTSEQGLRMEVKNLGANRTIHLASPFSVQFADGAIVLANQMRIVEAPAIEDLRVDGNASRASERIAGKGIRATLEDGRSGLRVHWRLELRDGSEYVRQLITLDATRQDLAMTQVRLLDAILPEAHVEGTVAGSPIVADQFFLGRTDEGVPPGPVMQNPHPLTPVAPPGPAGSGGSAQRKPTGFEKEYGHVL